MKKREEFYDFTKESEVPEIVNRKCREAYNSIFDECEKAGGVKNGSSNFKSCNVSESEMSVISGASPAKSRKFTLRRGLAIAACTAVMGAFTIPVAAKYIPALQSAFGYTSKKVYTKDPAEKVDLTKYAAPVNQTEEAEVADVVMQSIFCDGSNISAAFALTPKSDVFKDCTSIRAFCYIKLDGKDLNYRKESNEYIDMYFMKSDDGNFYTVVHYEGLDITENSKFSVRIYGFQGENYYRQHGTINADGSICYDPETTELIKSEFNFEQTVKPDTSNNKVYDVNEEDESDWGITLDSIEVTPFMTTVNIDGLDDCCYLEMYDQDGYKFDGMYVDGDLRYHFTSPLTTSKTLSIEVHRTDMDGMPAVCAFAVPIEKGFADPYTVDYNIDESKVVYDPPMEELEAKLDNERKTSYTKLKECLENGEVKTEPVGTNISYEAIDLEKSAEEPFLVDLDVKITGSSYDSIYNYDIPEDEIQWCYDAIDNFDIDSAKILLVTYEITNNTDTSVNDYFSPFMLVPKNSLEPDYAFTNSLRDEPIYVSYKQNYGKASNLYNFEAHQTYTITYGYVVSGEVTDDGFWISPNGFDSINSIIKGKEKLYEIE